MTKLYRVTNTLKNLEDIKRLELSIPAKLEFSNRIAIADKFETLEPICSDIDEIWDPPSDDSLPIPILAVKDDTFFPDFFMNGLDFFSETLRKSLKDFDSYITYVRIDDSGSYDVFRQNNYAAGFFKHYSPFRKLFRDLIATDAFMSGRAGKFELRSDLDQDLPIFQVAGGPWVMCTSEFFETAMKSRVSGLSFFDYETDEEFVPPLS